jgi:uroporphyrin-III C-methyltransferase / precorrin-2 dehydrogenase / sirohydrochlorin ferrochelatase
VTWPALPLFLQVAGRPVILVGEGEAAEAKRRLLLRAGAAVVGEDADARLAIVALENEAAALDAVARLRARGVLVNAVDRPELCDFTLPAIVDRAPVLVAIGTGGVSAGLAAALRQRLEALLPGHLGSLAQALFAAREALRDAYPDVAIRRRAIASALAPGGVVDPFGPDPDVSFWLMDDRSAQPSTGGASKLVVLRLTSGDPDELTLRQARLLANADRVFHTADVPAAILDRARADAARHAGPAPADPGPGLTLAVSMA